MTGTACPQKLKDLGYIGDSEKPYVPTNVASATVTLTEWKPLIAVNLQASGVSVIKLPHWALWDGKEIVLSVTADAGGECQIVDFAGNDILGDNLGAVTDFAVVRNVDGRIITVIKEVSS